MTTPRPAVMRRALLACVATTIVTGCATPEPVPDTATATTAGGTTTTAVVADPATQQMAAARARWAAAGLATYHFVLEDDCGECDPEWAMPREVVVWDEEVIDTLRRNLGVDQLFDAIEAAISAGAAVEVSYHDQFGYPMDVWIDREARAYDGGTHLVLRDLAAGLPGLDITSEGLEAARQRWAAAGPPAYEYRTDIMCDCSYDLTLWTLVEGSRILDWRIEWSRDPAPDVAPSTIDQLFSDLQRLVSEGELEEGGAIIRGGAAYHPELGYPTWIGLDVEVTDPSSPLGDLPPRIVFAVRDVEPHDLSESEYDRALARWMRVGPRDYTYQLTVHDVVEGTFGPPHIVTVANGALASVTGGDAPVFAGTVDDLFDQIDAWTRAAWQVDVVYDARLGHPVLVVAHHGDETVAFSIEELRPG